MSSIFSFFLLKSVLNVLTHIYRTGSAVYVYGIMNNKDDQAVKSKGITSSTYVTFMIDGVPVGSPFTHSPNNQLVEGTYWEFDVLMYANASLGCYGIHNLTIMNGGGTHKSAFLFDYIKYTYVLLLLVKRAESSFLTRFDDALESNTYSSYIPPTCPTPGSDANKGYNPASTTIPGYPAGPTSSTSGGSNGIPSPFQTGDPSGNLDNTAGHHSTSHSGKIAGIVVGVLAGLGIMGAILFLCCRRRKDDGGSKNWYKWEPGSPEALQNPQPPMTQQVGNAASLPHLTQDGVPAVDRRRSGVPPFLRRGSNWSIFGRQQSRITPFAGTGGVGRRNRPVNKLSIGDLKSPASITSTDDTTVANSVPFSPNSRFSEDNYFPVGTNITIPNRAPQVDPSTNSSSDESPTAAFTAQLHALAREVSLLRSEQGGMNQSHTGGLELPPVYEDHHEDDVLSSHDSRRT